MSSIQQEIDAVKAGLRSLNELLMKKGSKCPDGLGEEFECMAAMLKEAESSYKEKMSARKAIVASKKEPHVGKEGDKKLPDAIKTIYNVSNELKKLSQIDPEEPEEPEVPAKEKVSEKKQDKPKAQEGGQAKPKPAERKQVNPKNQGKGQKKRKNAKSKKQAKKAKTKAK